MNSQGVAKFGWLSFAPDIGTIGGLAKSGAAGSCGKMMFHCYLSTQGIGDLISQV